MPINPLYADAIKKQNGEKSNDYPKHPSLKFKNVGDKVVGKVTKVGDPFPSTSEWKGVVRDVTKQVLELTDATLTYVADDDEEPVTEFFPKLNIWLQKTGEFAAIGAELIRLELSDIPLNSTFGWKWSGLGEAVGDGARPHKFKARIVPPGA